MTMTAPYASLDPSAMTRRSRSVWRHFFDAATEVLRQKTGQVSEYRQRHRHNLPPEVRIALERTRKRGQTEEREPLALKGHFGPLAHHAARRVALECSRRRSGPQRLAIEHR